MTAPTLELSYFDFHGGRGEPIRLALTVGGIDFTDHRVGHKDWAALKPTTPLGQLPVLKVDGKQLTQMSAILRYVGRLADLYPSDAWQATLCDQVLCAVDALSGEMLHSFMVKGDAQREAREQLVAGPLPRHLKALGTWLEEAGGEWFADGRLTVADLSVAETVRSLRTGKLDHISTELVAEVAPGLVEHRERVLAVPEVAAYYARVAG